MERHTTRGGWKPVKHERILKPETNKNDDDLSNGRSAGNRLHIFPRYPDIHDNGDDKFLNPDD